DASSTARSRMRRFPARGRDGIRCMPPSRGGGIIRIRSQEERMVELPLVGGCQCGRLRYAISEPPLMVYNCHCTNCQKIGGGAFSTPLTVLESGFAFVAGEPRTIEWKSEAGNARFGWFCGACGSRIA